MERTYPLRQKLPAEVLVDGSRYAIIRERQSLDALLEEETIPDWL